MLKLKSLCPIDYACFAFIGLMTVIAVRFVWVDSLGAYSDDSVSYILMAQSMSPYFDTVSVIKEAASREHYPPLFSFFLAISGVSHSYLASHIVVALMFSVALLLTYCLANQILRRRSLALLVTVLFALSPSAWLNMLGILSENMYLVLSLACILIFKHGSFRSDNNSPPLSLHNFYSNRLIQFGALLVLLILCRSLGIALVAAYAVTLLIHYKRMQVIFDWRFFFPVFTPLMAASIWSLSRDNSNKDLYASDVSNIFSDIINASNPPQQLVSTIAPQLNSLVDSWYTAFELYWRESLTASHLVISLFALCALAGLLLRLKQNHLDAWYIVFYLLVLAVWPYPEQFNRFIYVLMPFFIIHGIYFIHYVFQKVHFEKSALLSSVAALFLLVSVAPASTFIYQRAQYVTPYEDMDFKHVTPFYHFPDIDIAKQVAYRHEHLRQDLQKINTTVAANEMIMWYTPNYINLISRRKAVHFPTMSTELPFLQQVQKSKASYVFSSDLIPRYTDLSVSGLTALQYFKPFSTIVWSRKQSNTGKVFSMLVKIDHKKLTALINAAKSK